MRLEYLLNQPIAIFLQGSEREVQGKDGKTAHGSRHTETIHDARNTMHGMDMPEIT